MRLIRAIVFLIERTLEPLRARRAEQCVVARQQGVLQWDEQQRRR